MGLKQKKKISASIQTGYHCPNCNFENVVHGFDPIPPLCENCGEAKLKQVWKNKVTTLTTIESI